MLSNKHQRNGSYILKQIEYRLSKEFVNSMMK